MLLRVLKSLAEKEPLRVAGMMSGTSFDGIDVAVLDVYGTFKSLRFDVVELCYHPYPDSLRRRISEFLENPDMDVLAELDLRIGKEHVEALRKCESDFDLVSMHGQTVWHVPKIMSLQVGNSDLVAVETGKIVVSDFRRKDIALGGEGAPLVPYVDYCIFHRRASIALVNLGGIANVTVVTERPEDVIAFDTGPANALVDLAARLIGYPYDEDGKVSSGGKIHRDVALRVLGEDEYVFRDPPKSTGKERYNSSFLSKFGLVGADLVATAAYYTALTLAKSFELHILPKVRVEKAYFSGGGTKNPFMMRLIEEELSRLGIEVHVFWWKFSDFKEAMWFAILGSEALKGEFSNLPSVTGAIRAGLLGRISTPL